MAFHENPELRQCSYILFGLVGMPPFQISFLILQEWLGVVFFVTINVPL